MALHKENPINESAIWPVRTCGTALILREEHEHHISFSGRSHLTHLPQRVVGAAVVGTPPWSAPERSAQRRSRRRLPSSSLNRLRSLTPMITGVALRS